METLKFNVESIKHEEGDTVLRAVSLTEDFLPKPWLEYAAKDSVNQRLIWRHSDPENPKYTDTVFGRVMATDIRDVAGKATMFTDYKLFGITNDHQTLLKLLKTRFEVGDPIGISMGYQVTKDARDNIKHLVVLEHSVTPFPQCPKCKTIELKESVVQMEDKEKIKTLQDKIDSLEDALNSKKEEFEEFSSKFVALEEEIKQKDSVLEKAKIENESVKDLIIELRDQITKLEKQREMDKKIPIITKIVALEGDEGMKKWYEKMSVEELEDRLKKVEGLTEGQPIVKSVSESRDDIVDETNIEKKEKKTFSEMFKNNPEIKKIYSEMKQAGMVE